MEIRKCEELLSMSKELNLLKLPTTIPTSYSHNGKTTSSLDHIFVSEQLYQDSHTQVLEKVPWNSSCHTPVIFQIPVSSKAVSSEQKKESSYVVPKKSINPELYKSCLENSLSEIDPSHMTPKEAVQLTILSIKLAELQSGEIVRMTKGGPKKKPPKLPFDVLQSKKASKRIWYLWKQQGRPGPEHPLTILKNKSTRSVRAAIRTHRRHSRENMYREVVTSSLVDPSKFSKLISNKKKTGCSTIYFKDELITDPEEGCNAWASYIEDLGTPANNSNWDQEYLACASECLTNIRSLYKNSSHGFCISPDDLEKSIRNLKSGKAADPDGIRPEHMKIGAEAISEFLAKQFTAMTVQGVPEMMKHEKKLPLPKKLKDQIYMDNHRCIGITSCFTKIYENITKRKEGDITQSSLQVGFTKGMTPLFAALALTEAVCHAKNTKQNLFAATMDASKAFDKVRRPLMLFELYRKGVSPEFWNVIDDLYSSTTAHVMWNGYDSKKFTIQEGTGQGRSLAGELYKVSIDPCINQCLSTGLGVHIGHVNSSCPTCADDMLLLANNSLELQLLMNTLNLCNSRSQTEINVDKSEVCSRTGSRPPIFYNNTQLPQTNQITHIGLKRNLKSPNSDVTANINVARRCLYGMIPAGIHGTNGVPPCISQNTLVMHVIPRLLSGIEAVIPSSDDIKRISVFYNQTVKRLLSLRESCSNFGAYILMGLLPIEAYIDIRLLQLLGAVTRLEANHPIQMTAKRQLAIPEKSKGWYTKALEVADGYNLKEIAIQALYGFISKQKWKSTVDSSVAVWWHHKIIDACLSVTSLKYLDMSKVKWGRAHYLWPVKGDSHLRTAASYRAKVITGTYLLQSHKAKFSQGSVSATCPLCKLEEEDVPHFILECPATREVRDIFMGRLACYGISLESDSICIEDRHHRAKYILNLGPSPMVHCNVNGHKERKMISNPCTCMKISNIINSFVLTLHNTRNNLLGGPKRKGKKKKQNMLSVKCTG